MTLAQEEKKRKKKKLKVVMGTYQPTGYRIGESVDGQAAILTDRLI